VDAAVLAWARAEAAGSDARELATAYASGIQRVRFSDGREVVYRTQAEMERAIETMFSASQSAASRRPSVTRAAFNRGW
jgi:hypothetical protein